MTEPTATIEEVAESGEYVDEYEMSTNKLASGTLTRPKSEYSIKDWDMVPDSEWLLRLTGGLTTAQLDDDDPYSPSGIARFDKGMPQGRGGMAAHTSAVKIVPTRGAVFTSGLKRGLLLGLLSVLGIALVASASFVLAETAWLSNLFAPPAPVVNPPATQPANEQPQTLPAPEQQVVPLPETKDSRPPAVAPSSGTQAESSDPSNPVIPSDIEEAALAGTDASVLRDRGIDAYKAGEYAQAAATLEQSVALNRDDPVAQFQLGLAYLAITGRDHSLDDAELAFRTTISLQPGWAAAHQMLAESFIRRGFFVEAIDPAKEATSIDPTVAEAWLTLGRAYTGAGMEADAEAAYAEAARYAPKP
jgi:tetratricopeptide (TPR) repeat protein